MNPIIGALSHGPQQTLAKCAVLLIVIGAVGYIAQFTDLSSTDDWTNIGAPFLLGI